MDGAQDFTPGPVLLLGAPGVGKGTQAKILMERWGLPQISTGDLIRDHIARRTPIGIEFQNLVASGVLVPDEIINQMVDDRLRWPDAARGYILDGFPRTLGQARWLDTYLGGCACLPVVAVLITVPYATLFQRITGRRTGKLTQRIFNIYTNPPAADDTEELVQRPDDREDVFAERMKTFAEQTQPVIDHYQQSGRFDTVNGEQSVEAVTDDVVAALTRLRQRS